MLKLYSKIVYVSIFETAFQFHLFTSTYSYLFFFIYNIQCIHNLYFWIFYSKE